jgi:hypothetical protein
MRDSLTHTHDSMIAMKVRARLLTLTAVGTLVAVAACGPSDIGASKLKGLEHGDPRSEVLERIGQGTLTGMNAIDSARLVNGHLHQIFLSKGERYEVIWYRETPGALNDSIGRTFQTPIVIHADTVEGWGWKFFEKRSLETGIPNPYRPTVPAAAPANKS